MKVRRVVGAVLCSLLLVATVFFWARSQDTVDVLSWTHALLRAHLTPTTSAPSERRSAPSSVNRERGRKRRAAKVGQSLARTGCHGWIFKYRTPTAISK